ncbi:hypothetical protein [Aliidiomarina indica]|uniref:hypothetical protein n=1 Tax=Aliidiomarina indica TaxID=2749147 RepID=UPI00188F9307|nr:hypothetical protein [Aliidiomarina indica]
MRGILLFAVMVLLTACSPEPRNLELHVIVAEAHTLDSQVVTTRGTVRMYADPEHYWIEDDALNRVGLHGMDVSSYVGSDVEVTGRFSVSRERGRHLEVTDVMVLSQHE